MKAISYPLTLDDSGRIVSTENPAKIYLDRILTLMSTNVKQRPVLQSYGTNVGKALFENDSNITTAIDAAVRESIAAWLPDIYVNKVSVSLPNEEGVSDVEIIVKTPDGRVSVVTLTTATFGYDGTITS